jgi:hypothetical protein
LIISALLSRICEKATYRSLYHHSPKLLGISARFGFASACQHGGFAALSATQHFGLSLLADVCVSQHRYHGRV